MFRGYMGAQNVPRTKKFVGILCSDGVARKALERKGRRVGNSCGDAAQRATAFELHEPYIEADLGLLVRIRLTADHAKRSIGGKG